MTKRVMVSVYSSVAWPAEEAEIDFGGQRIRLVPPLRNPHPGIRSTYPMAVIDRAEGDPRDAVRVIRRFLNALSWREQSFIREIDVSYGGPLLRHSTNIPDGSTTSYFEAVDLPDPQDDAGRVALALYREGLALEDVHIAYAFLSYFKVLNVRFAGGKDQIQWIDGQIGALKGERTLSRVQEIFQTHTTVGDYLYTSGRCAVAHAFANPVVSPDDIEDQQRLSKDMPLIRAFAALLLQSEYAVTPPKYPLAT